MHIRVQKWGNSLAFRIPRSFACEAAIGQGTTVDLGLQDGCLVVTPVKKRAVLKELLAKVDRSNLHCEGSFGARQGAENW